MSAYQLKYISNGHINNYSNLTQNRMDKKEFIQPVGAGFNSSFEVILVYSL